MSPYVVSIIVLYTLECARAGATDMSKVQFIQDFVDRIVEIRHNYY